MARKRKNGEKPPLWLADPRVGRFVTEFIKTGRRRDSAIAAGYPAAGAAVQAGRLLERAEVQEMLSDAMAAAKITASRVMRELGRIGFSNVAGLFRADGHLKPPSAWEPDIAAAVQSLVVEEREDGTVAKRVRMHSKIEALRVLAEAAGVIQRKDLASLNLGQVLNIQINTEPPPDWRVPGNAYTEEQATPPSPPWVDDAKR